MKITGKLIVTGEEAPELISIIAQSLEPDNLSNIKTELEGNAVTITFSAEKIGTILSSVDDYLMNAKIASDMLEKVGKPKERTG